MSSYTRWKDIRTQHVRRAGGEEAVKAGKDELLAAVIGERLAEVRRSRGLTQQQVADRMGVTKGRISQIERGKVSGQEVRLLHAFSHIPLSDRVIRHRHPLAEDQARKAGAVLRLVSRAGHRG